MRLAWKALEPWAAVYWVTVVGCLISTAAVAQNAGVTQANSAESVEDNPLSWDLGSGWRATLGIRFEERVTSSQISALEIGRPLADDRDRLDPLGIHENRLRLSTFASFTRDSGWFREIRVDVAADLLSGPFGTSLEDPLLARDSFQPYADGLGSADAQHLRVASLTMNFAGIRLLGGRTINTWGLGILAQSADDDPMQFGFKRTGHYVNRVFAGIMPAAWWMGDAARTEAPFVLGYAYDWIEYDDRTRRRDGDEGNNQIVTAGWFGSQLQAGFFGVRRTTENDLALATNAWVADVFASYAFEANQWDLKVGTEWVYAVGDTEVLRSTTNPDDVDVEQFGGAVRFDANNDLFLFRLEGGVASGDSRPFDDTARGFAFASDHRVGVALFPEYLRRHTAISAQNISDPRFTGEPPVAIDEIPSRGGVSQAMYLHPVFGIRPFEQLTLMGGIVWARSTVDYADAYQTSLAGGEASGPRGARRKRELGTEINAGIRYRQPLGAGFEVDARFDAGILFPGEVFDTEDGESAAAFGVLVGQLMLRGQW